MRLAGFALALLAAVLLAAPNVSAGLVWTSGDSGGWYNDAELMRVGGDAHVNDVALSPTTPFAFAATDHSLYMFQLNRSIPIASFHRPRDDWSGGVFQGGLSASRDGAVVAWAQYDRMRILEVRSEGLNETISWKLGDPAPEWVALSPDGQRAYAATPVNGNAVVVGWNVADGSELWRRVAEHERYDYAPEADLFVLQTDVLDASGTVVLQGDTGKAVAEIPATTGPAVLSPDGERLLVLGDLGQLLLYELPQTIPTWAGPGFRGINTGLADFSADGLSFAVGVANNPTSSVEFYAIGAGGLPTRTATADEGYVGIVAVRAGTSEGFTILWFSDLQAKLSSYGATGELIDGTTMDPGFMPNAISGPTSDGTFLATNTVSMALMRPGSDNEPPDVEIGRPSRCSNDYYEMDVDDVVAFATNVVEPDGDDYHVEWVRRDDGSIMPWQMGGVKRDTFTVDGDAEVDDLFGSEGFYLFARAVDAHGAAAADGCYVTISSVGFAPAPPLWSLLLGVIGLVAWLRPLHETRPKP